MLLFACVLYFCCVDTNENQKTGNAIRALGRMAILSANSRRNSSTTTSTVTNSPRPSMSNGSVPTEPLKPTMQPLNEEDIVSEPIPLPPPPAPKAVPIDQTDNINFTNGKSTELTIGSMEKSERLLKEKTCTERSDSGFSDCSSSSNGQSNLAAHVPSNAAVAHPLFDKINSISEEKLSSDQSLRENNANNVKEFGGKLSVNMLKLKLEKMAEAQQDTKTMSANKKTVRKLSTPFVVETSSPDEMHIDQRFEGQQMRTSYSFDFEDADIVQEFDSQPKSLPMKPNPKTLIRSASLHQKRIVEKEPIMKSDFTNTVKMRKKSLESSAAREKQIHSPRILLEPSGKVSKLLRRFDSQNGTANGDSAGGEPLVQTPGVEDTSKEIQQKDHYKDETSKADDEVFEILSTPMAAAQKSSTSKRKSPSKIAKTIVSSGSMKRTFTSKHEYTNTKTCVTSMEVKVTHRQSPTKFANTVSNAPHNRATPKAISNQTNKHSNALKQKSHKSTAVDERAVASVQRSPRNATAANKTTAYSSFNRTSPVRLSGRVKEVTDRLSAPKAIVKSPSPIKDRTIQMDMKMPTKNAMAQALAHEHHQMAMKSMSGTIKQHIVTVAEAVIETEHHVEHTINGKIDGTFTLKSKMNENFRKASAFWKAT